MREWKDSNQAQYYFNREDGKIIGQVHVIAHTQVWLAKIILNHNEEKYLGQYISMEFAKKSVERYWYIDERTFLQDGTVYGNV